MRKSGTYHHGDLRHELVRRARDRLNSEGSNHISLRQLAAEVGVAHTALYTHFPTKEALIRAVLVEGYMRLSHLLIQGVDAKNRPLIRLVDASLIYHQFCRDEPKLFQTMTGARLNADGKHQELEQALQSAYRFIADPISELSDSSALREATAPAFWASLQGFLGQILTGRVRVRHDQEAALVEQYVHALSVGLGLTHAAD